MVNVIIKEKSLLSPEQLNSTNNKIQTFIASDAVTSATKPPGIVQSTFSTFSATVFIVLEF